MRKGVICLQTIEKSVESSLSSLETGAGEVIESPLRLQHSTLCKRSSEAGLVAPFIYATLIFMMLFDFGVLGVVPDLISLAGAGVIITCGSYIAIREHLQDTRQRNDVSGRLILIISSAPSCIEYDHAGNAPRHNRQGCSHCR